VIYIDYINGMHGRFLCYSINALDPNFYTRNEEIFSSIGTINNIFEPLIADCNHYSSHGHITPENQTITITGSSEDELLIELLYWHRMHEYAFDLYNLNIDFYNKVKGTYLEGITNYFKNSGYNPETTQVIPKEIFRKYFKDERRASDRLKLLNPNTICKIYFRRLYSYGSFIKVLLEIKDKFNLSYNINVAWYHKFWNQYMKNVQPILEEERTVYNIMHDIKNKKETAIKLNLLQEAWIEFFVNKQYNCNIFPIRDTYQNTKEIIDQL